MAKNVVLHVGTPKTGTSMVQDLLTRNGDGLREHGVLVPTGAFDHQYRAGLDLLGHPGEDNEGAWDRLAARVRKHRGTAVISNEILTRATSPQIDRAAASFGYADLDVIVTVRDLGRQIASGWQEAVKHRAKLSFAGFLAALHEDPPRRRVARGFWAVQDWPAAVARWSTVCGPARVHIVTVPPESSDPAVLRDRVLRAMKIDRSWVPRTPERLNSRIGAAETKVLRGINARNRPADLDAGQYAEFVRERLVPEIARRAERPAPIGLPPSEHAWVAELSAQWLDRVKGRGYQLVGDLADLEPRPTRRWSDPDAVPPMEELAAANLVIDALLNGEIAEREGNVDRFYEIARSYARRRAGRLRVVRGVLRTRSRMGGR